MEKVDKQVGHFYSCCVKRKDGNDIHIWQQNYENQWAPSDTMRSAVAHEVFEVMMSNGMMKPNDRVLIFTLAYGIVVPTQITHADFPPNRISNKMLIKLWLRCLRTPMPTPTTRILLLVNSETGKIQNTEFGVTNPPALIQILKRLAAEARNPTCEKLVSYTSNRPYNASEAANSGPFGKACFDTFIERFYKSPSLLQQVKQAFEQKRQQKQMLHCSVEWEKFEAGEPMDFCLIPMRRSPVWVAIQARELSAFELDKIAFAVQIIHNGHCIFSTVAVLTQDVKPLDRYEPITNFRVVQQERIAIRSVCGAGCGKTNPDMSQCSGCKTLRYCSIECQKRHWTSTHKEMCKRIAAIVSGSE